MAEPTSSVGAVASVVTLASGLSAITIALFGVDYYALVWGFIGAMFARGNADTMTRYRAIIYITLASCVGAAIGTGMLALAQTMFVVTSQKPALIFLSMAGGAGSQKLLDAVVSMITNRIQTIGETAK